MMSPGMYRVTDDPFNRTPATNGGGAWVRSQSPPTAGVHNANNRRPMSNGYFETYPIPNDDDVTYELDHLATYVMAPHRGLNSVDDALNRLRRMALTTGIWAKRLRLRVGARDLVVVENGDPIERFPLRLVGLPVAASAIDGYENVVIFTVAQDDVMRRPAEVHLFQCVGRSNTDLVNDIKAAKQGKPLQKRQPNELLEQPVYSQVRSSVIDNTPPADYPRMSARGPNPIAVAAAAVAAAGAIPPPVTVPATETAAPAEKKLAADERKVLDMKMLDRCISDIETFVAKLQKAAKDAKEGKPESERAPAPTAKDFYEIFQKFKTAFILLSRLKLEIRDPNASELLHLLFGPLGIIADATRSTDDNQPHLAEQVIAPLLTPGAINLLQNCVTSKEMELWKSLGRAWDTPCTEWTEAVPSFALTFADGTVAPKEWLHDLTSFAESNFNSLQRKPPTNEAQPLVNGNSARPSSEGDRRSQGSQRRQKEFLQELQARGSKIYVVTRGRDAKNPKELSIEKDDIVEVIEDTKGWWKVRNSRGETGFVPNTLLEPAMNA